MKFIKDKLFNQRITRRSKFKQFYIFDICSVFYIHNIRITGNNDIS